jgi:hypothetical protein
MEFSGLLELMEEGKEYSIPSTEIQFKKCLGRLRYRSSLVTYWNVWTDNRVTDTTGCCSSCSVHLDGDYVDGTYFKLLEYLCSWLGVNCIQTSVLSCDASCRVALENLGYLEAYRHPTTRNTAEESALVEVIQYYKVFDSQKGYPSDIMERSGNTFLDGQLDASSADF